MKRAAIKTPTKTRTKAVVHARGSLAHRGSGQSRLGIRSGTTPGFLDALTREHHVDMRADKRCAGDVGELIQEGERCRLLKPTTFMNHSGRSVAALANYYNIPANRIVVVYDEIDLPPGSV